MEYLSPQGVLLPLVYGTTASLLWLELRGHPAWQATPSWTVYRLACHQWPPVLCRAGMRRIITITIVYPLWEPIWLMFLGMQGMILAIL